MIELVNAIIIISLIIIIYKYCEQHSYDVVMVKSNVNGKNYLVRNLEDKQSAADMLGAIAVKLQTIVDILRNTGYEQIYIKYMKADLDKENGGNDNDSNISNKKKDIIEGQDGGGSGSGSGSGSSSNASNNTNLEHDIKVILKEDIKRLVKNYNPEALSETTPDSQYTSYSVNKGEKLIMCLRSKQADEKLVKENIMTFVSIHELAHLMTKSIGHSEDFWNNMRLLLKIAIDNDLYKNVDFNKTPEPYCGIKISDNPLK